jgi:hypothetical protein
MRWQKAGENLWDQGLYKIEQIEVKEKWKKILALGMVHLC